MQLMKLFSYSNVGRKLMLVRQEKSVSLEEAAQYCGCSKDEIYEFEMNQAKISGAAYRKLLKLYNKKTDVKFMEISHD